MNRAEPAVNGDHGEYELWDGETGNCVGAYATRAAALRDVADTVHRYGAMSPEVTSLVLMRLDTPPGAVNGLSGSELVREAAARERATQRTRAAT